MTVEPDTKIRFWEIDCLRGLAVVLMIFFHFVTDLDFLRVWDVELYSGFWWFFPRAIAATFILLVGTSLTLSLARVRQTRLAGARLYPKYLKRGLVIFSWGLVITLGTWLLYPQGFVIFGILHFIGVAIILAYPFLRFRYGNLVLGVILIALGVYLEGLTVGFPWLVWLGLRPRHFHTVDYFPLLPWFGVVLIGVFLGHTLYPGYTRRFRLPDGSNLALVRGFGFLGRHSLLIYLIHQPILLALAGLLLIAQTGLTLFAGP